VEVRGQFARRVQVGRPVDDHDELVAAEASEDRALGADDLLEAHGDPHEQLVAGGVPEAVVDHPEAVEVDEQDGRACSACSAGPGRAGGARERLVDPVDQQ